jgi:hypothetical protein
MAVGQPSRHLRAQGHFAAPLYDAKLNRTGLPVVVHPMAGIAEIQAALLKPESAKLPKN